jgi:hypothetical protein
MVEKDERCDGKSCSFSPARTSCFEQEKQKKEKERNKSFVISFRMASQKHVR